MGKDIKIITDDFRFKYRVSGLLTVDNKLLVVRMGENDFYCLPGGHVELGEDTQSSIIREIKEEIGCDVYVKELFSITENFFDRNGHHYHELGFFYRVEPISLETEQRTSQLILEHDKEVDVELEIKWVTTQELEALDFKPTFIKSKLIGQDYHFEHKIIKQ